MLRGRSSCAISERPTPSPAPKYPLSPIIPVHPGNSPVSPIIPVHTQKQGGGAHFFWIAVCSSSVRSVSSAVSFLPGAFSHSPLATSDSPLSPIIPAPLATAALRVAPAPIFTTTSRSHVGAPTILLRERATPSQQSSGRRAMLSSNCALLTVGRELLFSPKSFVSPTSAPFSRKSNHSRTYAKDRGWGRYLSDNVSKICRRADIFGHPTDQESRERTDLKVGHYTRKTEVDRTDTRPP
jgi:hypothetical protein